MVAIRKLRLNEFLIPNPSKMTWTVVSYNAAKAYYNAGVVAKNSKVVGLAPDEFAKKSTKM
jgi:hypothetical protein